MWIKITKAVNAVVSVIVGFLGGWSPLLTMTGLAILLDYITGLITAFMGKSQKTESGGVSSRVGFAGFVKKMYVIIVLLVATMLDRVLDNGTMVFQTAAAMYFFANECISIIENTALMGVPIPERLRGALDIMKKDNDKTE